MRAALRAVLLRGASTGLDLNFAGGAFSLNNLNTSNPANIPGWSFSRTDTNGTATALDLAGNVIQFATGVPRITNRGILVEEARTNLLLRSTEFDNGAVWAASRATITANATTAPDGSVTADKLVENSSTNTHRVYQAVSKAGSSIQYTASMFFKAAERTFAHLRMTDSIEDDRAGVGINLSTGEVGTPYVGGGSPFTSVSASSQALVDGWYRLTLTATTDTDTTVQVWAFTADGLTSASCSTVGNSVNGVFVWGAQLEAGAFATSPIITTGAAGTRGAEVPHIATSSVLYPFTLVADFTYEGADSSVSVNNRVAAAVTDGANDNRTQIYNLDGVGGAVTQVGGITQAAPSVGSTAAVGVTQRIAYRAQADNFIVARNGTLSAADTSGSVPSVTSLVSIGKGATGSPLNGYVQRVRVFPFAATNAQLQALTAP
jgi:hypothetical protein